MGRACRTRGSNVKQVQAATNVKYKALLTKLQEERDASSDKVTRLEAHITELQRILNRANAAAHAVNKENAAAVYELKVVEGVREDAHGASTATKSRHGEHPQARMRESRQRLVSATFSAMAATTRNNAAEFLLGGTCTAEQITP
eukprot:1474266-Pleurochrysis_carterae.AAC.2